MSIFVFYKFMKKKNRSNTEEVFTGTQVGALIERFEDKLEVLSEGHNSINQRLDTMNERIGGLEHRTDRLETHVVGMGMRMDGMAVHMGKMESRMDGMENRMGTMETQMKNIAGDIVEIKHTLDRKADRAEVENIDKRITLLEQTA